MKSKTQSGGKNNIDWGSVFTANKEQMPINYWMDEATLDKYLKSKSLSAHTSDFYKKEITAFGSFLDALGLIEATLNECNRYLVARRDEVSPGSARVVRGILVGYGKYLDTNGMISDNPFAKTSEKELRITKHDSEAATKKAKGLYSLKDIAQLLLAIDSGDVAAITEIIH